MKTINKGLWLLILSFLSFHLTFAQDCPPTGHNGTSGDLTLNAFYLDGVPLLSSSPQPLVHGSTVSLAIYSTAIASGVDVYADVFVDANNDGVFTYAEQEFTGMVTSNANGYANFTGTIYIDPSWSQNFNIRVTLNTNLTLVVCQADVSVDFASLYLPGSPLGMVVLNDDPTLENPCFDVLDVSPVYDYHVDLVNSFNITVGSGFGQPGNISVKMYAYNPDYLTTTGLPGSNLGPLLQIPPLTPGVAYFTSRVLSFTNPNQLLLGTALFNPLETPHYERINKYMSRQYVYDQHGWYQIEFTETTLNYFEADYIVCEKKPNLVGMDWPIDWFAPNPGGMDERLGQSNEANFILRQNPVHNRIALQLSNVPAGPVSINLINLQGQTVQHLYAGDQQL
ncbi:MAG: hypothetical protein AAF206_07240, partial [Bacteroidota bacterium]